MRTDGKISLPCEPEMETEKLREWLRRQGYDLVKRDPILTFESFARDRK